jgi:predicted cobalt transporter CbtA
MSRTFRRIVAATAASGCLLAIPLSAAQAAPNAWISQFCVNANVYEKATNMASKPTEILWVNRDGVHIAQLNTRTNGFRGEYVPAGTHTYEITNYAGTVTVAGPVSMTGGNC